MSIADLPPNARAATEWLSARSPERFTVREIGEALNWPRPKARQAVMSAIAHGYVIWDGRKITTVKRSSNARAYRYNQERYLVV